MGVASRELPGGALPMATTSVARSWTAGEHPLRIRVHGSHLLPMDHDRRNDRSPAPGCATGISPVAVSPPAAQPPPTPIREATTPQTGEGACGRLPGCIPASKRRVAAGLA